MMLSSTVQLQHGNQPLFYSATEKKKVHPDIMDLNLYDLSLGFLYKAKKRRECFQ